MGFYACRKACQPSEVKLQWVKVNALERKTEPVFCNGEGVGPLALPCFFNAYHSGYCPQCLGTSKQNKEGPLALLHFSYIFLLLLHFVWESPSSSLSSSSASINHGHCDHHKHGICLFYALWVLILRDAC
jgi:hypothetical protein